jgi:hypothetical protein
VDCVAGLVEVWQDMRLVVEDMHEVRCSRQVWWFGPQNLPALHMAGFAQFGPQNSATVVLEGTGGVTWRDPRGCIKAKQLHVKDMAVESKTYELVHFAPSGMDRLYVNMSSLGSENNPVLI